MMTEAIVSSKSTPPTTPPNYPRTYVAPKLPDGQQHLVIDGDLDKAVWKDVPWSDLFDDIRGLHDAPADERPRPTCGTRVKMMWSDEFLFIAALIQSDFETVATLMKRNSVIFGEDSDFEVFLDPLGSCQFYKEYEANALGTVWNLMLDKPYADSGFEHSARVAKPGEDQYYEVLKQETATKVLSGKLNDPSGDGATYSIEIKMSFSDILAHLPEAGPVTKGSRWKINFSRVEKKGKINWTWQPQIAWSPVDHTYRGYVDMHRPDAWGYLVFGETAYDEFLVDPAFGARLAAMSVYYAQHEYKSRTGDWASDIGQLTNLVDQQAVSPMVIDIDVTAGGFLATVSDLSKALSVTVTDERHVKLILDQE